MGPDMNKSFLTLSLAMLSPLATSDEVMSLQEMDAITAGVASTLYRPPEPQPLPEHYSSVNALSALHALTQPNRASAAMVLKGKTAPHIVLKIDIQRTTTEKYWLFNSLVRPDGASESSLTGAQWAIQTLATTR